MSTESIARDMIAAAESAPTATPSTPEGSNAHEYVDIARQEFESYVADDPQNPTRRAAAAAMTTLDRRPFVSTHGGLVRRQFQDDGNPTRRAARELIDQAAAVEGMKADPRDKRAMAAHDFAADVNKSTMEGTLPEGGSVFAPGSDEWRESADAVIEQIIRRGRESR